MTRRPEVARRAERLLGAAVVATAPVAGGDTSTATRLRLSDGRVVLMKTHPHAPEGFFEAEARGLRWLAAAEPAGGAAVAELLGHDDACLLVRWVDPGKPSTDASAAFGAALEATHAAGAPWFGLCRDVEDPSPAVPADGFVGRLPLPNRPAPSWAEFFATRRLLPYLALARDRGAVEADDAAAVEKVVARLGDLVPDEPPARLHGDLWGGNVLWGAGGAVLVDPAAHGGHRESDLAMLALFGLPHLDAALTAYSSAAAAAGRPLADGWRERAAVHQLFPLLVHACLFGGGYGARAAAAARSL